MVKKNIDISRELTSAQLTMLESAENMPIVFDEDSPELTPEDLKQFKRISAERQASRRKQTVTLRLSPQALKSAKALGKGYTSVLSRILEAALADKEQLKQFL